jgi:DNA-binding response OmpR family regulator
VKAANYYYIMSHILLVEDEERMAQTLIKGLKKVGFGVTHINNGLSARVIDITDFDAVVLDWMLPGFSGIDLLRNWRSNKQMTPVLMLTAKGEVRDKVDGLNFGADDYMTKFFEWPELIARLNALIRRNTLEDFIVGTIQLDRHNEAFSENAALVNLTATEYKILKYFFDHPTRLISKTSLVRAVYDQASNPYSNVIERHIKSIRKKFTYDPITTNRGLGYRLNTSTPISPDSH